MRMTVKEHQIAITKHKQQHHKRIMLPKEIYKRTTKIKKENNNYKGLVMTSLELGMVNLTVQE